MKKAILIKSSILMILTMMLTGCHQNWHGIDKIVKKINCQSNDNQIKRLAKLESASYVHDEVSDSITLAKGDDAITVFFNKQQKIQVIAYTQSKIEYFGLVRRQGDVIISEQCH